MTDRQRVFEHRLNEAEGGPYASNLSILLGFTAGTFLYSRAQRKGFPGFFPLNRLNAGYYAVILAGSFVGYQFGNTLVSTITGDIKQATYMRANKADILMGRLPFDRLDATQ